ncbi:MAG: hypothetical protein K6G63_04180 [Eubacterium sp.]|nr:hypothetical protein [Eubacterium sp.]
MKRLFNNRFLFAMMAISCLIFTGCETKKLSEEQENNIAAYSAHVLLQHSQGFDKRLVKNAEVTEAPVRQEVRATAAPTKAPAASPNQSTDNGETAADPNATPAPKEVDINAIYNISGVDIKYINYMVGRAYPKESNEYQLTAPKGHKLLVMEFDLKNQSGTTKKINLMKSGITYKLSLDGEEYSPTIVILENGGLNYLKTKLKAGGAERAILSFEVPDASAKFKEGSLKIAKNNSVSTITLK